MCSGTLNPGNNTRLGSGKIGMILGSAATFVVRLGPLRSSVKEGPVRRGWPRWRYHGARLCYVSQDRQHFRRESIPMARVKVFFCAICASRLEGATMSGEHHDG